MARYTVEDGLDLFLCTGQLVNNTAQDETPYLLTAFHCRIDTTNDDTVVTYWNYEAPVCGQRCCGNLGQTGTGSTFRMGEGQSDVALVERSNPPPPSFNVYYAGWDARLATRPQSSFAIHHPQGDVKSISWNSDPLGLIGLDLPGGGILDPSGDSHWEVDDWEHGTTERGSAGSCLWDPATKLCVGVLSAGLASCTFIEADFYGRLAPVWDGPNPATRLRDWLDPSGSEARMLAGLDPASIFDDGFESGDTSAWDAVVD